MNDWLGREIERLQAQVLALGERVSELAAGVAQACADGVDVPACAALAEAQIDIVERHVAVRIAAAELERRAGGRCAEVRHIRALQEADARFAAVARALADALAFRAELGPALPPDTRDPILLLASQTSRAVRFALGALREGDGQRLACLRGVVAGVLGSRVDPAVTRAGLPALGVVRALRRAVVECDDIGDQSLLLRPASPAVAV